MKLTYKHNHIKISLSDRAIRTVDQEFDFHFDDTYYFATLLADLIAMAKPARPGLLIARLIEALADQGLPENSGVVDDANHLDSMVEAARSIVNMWDKLDRRNREAIGDF